MRRFSLLLPLIALAAMTAAAAADDYPSRPIRAIASQGPGGLSDLFMRALGDQMGQALGTTIVVEDRAGAEGTIGAKACADAAPDGYTICILPGEAVVINPIIQPSDFDPSQRLVPVARPYYLTQMFAVSASLPAEIPDQPRADAGPEIGRRVRQGAGRRSRRRARGGEGVGDLSGREVAALRRSIFAELGYARGLHVMID